MGERSNRKALCEEGGVFLADEWSASQQTNFVHFINYTALIQTQVAMRPVINWFWSKLFFFPFARFSHELRQNICPGKEGNELIARAASPGRYLETLAMLNTLAM